MKTLQIPSFTTSGDKALGKCFVERCVNYVVHCQNTKCSDCVFNGDNLWGLKMLKEVTTGATADQHPEA